MEAQRVHLGQVTNATIGNDAAASERTEDIGVYLTPKAAGSWRLVDVFNDDDARLGDVERVPPQVCCSRKLLCLACRADACCDGLADERAEAGKTADD